MMAFTLEPDVSQNGQKPETILQEAVKNEVAAILKNGKDSQSLVEYFIFPGFGLDLAVFMQQNDGFTIRFFELKAFVGSRQGGIGFGNGYGEGLQVDLLLLKEGQLKLADRFIRWIVVDGTKPLGTKRFVIVNNSQAKGHAMGGVSIGKQNNLRVSSLMTTAMSWDDLLEELKAFLL